jgi:hypothetical protein
MSDEKDFPIQPPDPDNQLPAPDEPAGQLEPPPSGGAAAYETPASEPVTETFFEPIPPAKETPATGDTIVTPPPAAPPPPAKKNNRTIWIIVIVALVVLCCCCLIAIGLAVLGLMPFQDQMEYWYLVPGLSQFI